MQAKANGEGERKREEKRGEWERVMGTEHLCKTKESERLRMKRKIARPGLAAGEGKRGRDVLKSAD